MQKFFKDTIVSSFVKEFVYSQNIPLYTSAVDGDFVIANTNYIYGNKIIKIGNASGILGGNYGVSYSILRDYKFNERIPKITENFLSKYKNDNLINLIEYILCYYPYDGCDYIEYDECIEEEGITVVRTTGEEKIFKRAEVKYVGYNRGYYKLL